MQYFATLFCIAIPLFGIANAQETNPQSSVLAPVILAEQTYSFQLIEFRDVLVIAIWGKLRTPKPSVNLSDDFLVRCVRAKTQQVRGIRQKDGENEDRSEKVNLQNLSVSTDARLLAGANQMIKDIAEKSRKRSSDGGGGARSTLERQ